VADDDRDPNGGIHYSPREMFDEIRKDIANLSDEIRKSRHDLAGKLATLSLRVDALEYQQRDTIRRFNENDDRAAKYIPMLEQVLVDQSLTERMKKAGWTQRERMLAYGLFLFAFVGAAGTIVSLVVLARGG
jgi:hypothetical protein